MQLPSSPWNQTSEQVLRALDTSEDGLSSAEARRRKTEVGPNQLRRIERQRLWMILFDQIKSLVVVLLIAAAGVSFLFGETARVRALRVPWLFVPASPVPIPA